MYRHKAKFRRSRRAFPVSNTSKKRAPDVMAFPLAAIQPSILLRSFARTRDAIATFCSRTFFAELAVRNAINLPTLSFTTFHIARNNDIAKPWTRVSRFSMAPLISRARQCLFALNERRNCREASPMPERRLFRPPTLVITSFANNRDNGGSSYSDNRHQRRSRSRIASQ